VPGAWAFEAAGVGDWPPSFGCARATPQSSRDGQPQALAAQTGARSVSAAPGAAPHDDHRPLLVLQPLRRRRRGHLDAGRVKGPGRARESVQRRAAGAKGGVGQEGDVPAGGVGALGKLGRGEVVGGDSGGHPDPPTRNNCLSTLPPTSTPTPPPPTAHPHLQTSSSTGFLCASALASALSMRYRASDRERRMVWYTCVWGSWGGGAAGSRPWFRAAPARVLVNEGGRGRSANPAAVRAAVRVDRPPLCTALWDARSWGLECPSPAPHRYWLVAVRLLAYVFHVSERVVQRATDGKLAGVGDAYWGMRGVVTR
jgi:hypothetical protein